MYIIDETYFIKDLAVPNVQPSLDIPNNEMAFEMYIDKYARQLLQNALGVVLFEQLDSQIENGSLKPTADQKWKDLVNGKTYQKDGRDLKWKGLIYSEGIFKGSILANYTYYHWHLDQVSRMSGMGEVKGKAVNTAIVNSTERSVRVWNQFIIMYQGFRSMGDGCHFSIKNGVPFYDYFGGSNSQFVDLLTFLSDHESDYPNALKLTESEGFNNSFGL